MLEAGSVNSDWYLGLTLGFAIVTVVVIVLAVILNFASRIAEQAWVANEGLKQVRERTKPLAAVRQTNASGLAVLAAARTAREAVVAKVTGAAQAPPEPPPAIPGHTRRSPSFGDPLAAPGDPGAAPEADPDTGGGNFSSGENAPAPAWESSGPLHGNPGSRGGP